MRLRASQLAQARASAAVGARAQAWLAKLDADASAHWIAEFELESRISEATFARKVHPAFEDVFARRARR